MRRAEVVEGGVRFPVDPLGGQKTGWFFDQRPNRDRVAALAKDARVLDVFCHVGAFGLRCAAAGAREVTLVDSSAPALAQAEQAAALNGVADRVHASGAAMRSMRWRRSPASGSTSWCATRRPSPARARMPRPGLRAYGRMARLAAPLVAPGGFLFVASCSHHAPLEAWSAQIAFGLHRARREGRILFTGGAGPGPSGASASAGDCVSEDAIDPGAVVAAFSSSAAETGRMPTCDDPQSRLSRASGNPGDAAGSHPLRSRLRRE